MSQVEVDAGDGRIVLYHDQKLQIGQGWMTVTVEEGDDDYFHWSLCVRGDGLIAGPLSLGNRIGIDPVVLDEMPMLDAETVLYQLPPEVLFRVFNVSLFFVRVNWWIQGMVIS